MSGNEIHELAVRISPEGAQETQQSLDNVSESFEDTADTAEQQSGKLEAFAERWKGAFGVIAAGLAVGVAALASQVPVLGELFSGLKAVVDSLALAMDSVLRPVLTPITNKLFELSNALDSAPAPVRKLVGLFTTLASAVILTATSFTILKGLGVVAFLGKIAAGAATAKTAVVGFASTTAGIASSILLIATAAGLLGSELLGLTNVTGIAKAEFGSFKRLIGNIAFIIGGPIIGAIKALIALVKGDLPGAFKIAKQFAFAWVNAIREVLVLANTGFMALKTSIITIFESAFAFVRSIAAAAINDLINKIEKFLNSAINAANSVSKITGIELDKIDIGEVGRKSIGEITDEQTKKAKQRAAAAGTVGRQQLQNINAGGAAGDGVGNRFAEDQTINVNISGEGALEEALSGEQSNNAANRGR